MSKADEIRDAIKHTVVRNQKLANVLPQNRINVNGSTISALIEAIAQVMADREDEIEKLMRAEFDRWGMG